MSKLPTADAQFDHRKPYTTPALKTYGNVHQITRAGDGNVTDNGKPIAHKTGIANL